MKKLLMFFLLLFGLLPTYSCSAAPKLSEAEARKIVEKHFGYPDVQYWQKVVFLENSPQAKKVMTYLVDNGYLLSSPRPSRWGGSNKAWDITEKGKPYFNTTIKTDYVAECNGLCVYQVACGRTVVKTVKEVLVDSKNGTGVVEYVVETEPFEPMYSSVCKDAFKSEPPAEYFFRTETKKAKLKRYDKGWRVGE